MKINANMEMVVAYLKIIAICFFEVSRRDDILHNPIITGETYAIIDPETMEIVGSVIIHGHEKKDGMETEEAQGDILAAESKTDILVAEVCNMMSEMIPGKEYNVCPLT